MTRQQAIRFDAAMALDRAKARIQSMSGVERVRFADGTGHGARSDSMESARFAADMARFVLGASR